MIYPRELLNTWNKEKKNSRLPWKNKLKRKNPRKEKSLNKSMKMTTRNSVMSSKLNSSKTG
jgi:hypothetical protein